jgi:hypothetical protein
MLSAATILLSVLTKAIPPWEKNYWCCLTFKLALRGNFCLLGDKFIKLDREVKSVYPYYGIGPNSSRNKDNPIFYFTVEIGYSGAREDKFSRFIWASGISG